MKVFGAPLRGQALVSDQARLAKAIEARSDGTPKSGPAEGESAVPEAFAQPLDPVSHKG